ncbi:MAG: HD domain-containing protein [Sedimentisphaerales bacterium]|nr:HD domain-containing protein [Sedimentisphaerales bacterium]
MEQKQFDDLVQWFGGYIQRYFSHDGDTYLNNNLHLKEYHTHRVCGETRLLAGALKLDANDTRIAETVALLHDVGRFEQFKKYRTYKDSTSEDHSAIGLRIIRQERILEGLDPQERRWIELAVDYHNKMALPEELDEKTALFCKIIRDTDKLDIYYVTRDYFRHYHENPCTLQLEIEFPDEPSCTPEILDAVEQGRLVDYRLLRTMNDVKLLQLDWAYDIYFDQTLRRIVELGYFKQIIALLPDTQEVKRATDAVLRYVDNRVSQPDA